MWDGKNVHVLGFHELSGKTRGWIFDWCSIDENGCMFVGVDERGLVVHSGFLHEDGAGGGRSTMLPRLEPRSVPGSPGAGGASRREG